MYKAAWKATDSAKQHDLLCGSHVHVARTGRRGQCMFQMFAMDAGDNFVNLEASCADDGSTDEDQTDLKTQKTTTLTSWKLAHDDVSSASVWT